MQSLSWIEQLCHGWRKSQVKTFTALWEAFVQAGVCNLSAIARSLSAKTGVGVRHTLKRLCRFLGNERINEDVFYENLVSFVWPRIKHWRVVPIAIDWTHCQKHECWQSLVASIVLRGRGIPILVWSYQNGDFDEYGRSRSAVEDAFIKKLKSLLPQSPDQPQTIVIIADRGFARADLLQLICDQGFHYCIRLKTSYIWQNENFHYLHRDRFDIGERRVWQDVDYPDRRAVRLARLVVTCATPKPGKEKDPWFLGSSLPWSADRLIDLYAKRMLIEEDFRTAKSDLEWKHLRIRKLSHYRRFVLFMVTCLVFSMILGLSAQRKPALAAQIVRKRKGKWDSCFTRIGLLLLQNNLAHINYLALMRRLPA